MTIDRGETRWLVRLDQEEGFSSAAALKDALVAALASPGRVELDLEQALAIDVTVLQLAFAAARAAQVSGAGFVVKASEAARARARLAGFAAFPGEPDTAVSDAAGDAARDAVPEMEAAPSAQG
jgi:hypothetical protein